MELESPRKSSAEESGNKSGPLIFIWGGKRLLFYINFRALKSDNIDKNLRKERENLILSLVASDIFRDGCLSEGTKVLRK